MYDRINVFQLRGGDDSTTATKVTLEPTTLNLKVNQTSTAGPFSQTLIDKHNALLAELMICNPRDFDRIWDTSIAEWMASGARIVVDERAAKYADVGGL